MPTTKKAIQLLLPGKPARKETEAEKRARERREREAARVVRG